MVLWVEQVDAAIRGERGLAAGFGDVGGPVESVQVQGGVTQGGHHLGSVAGADGRAVLVEGHVADPVDRVLDAPVLAQPGRDHRWSGVLERQAAQSVDDLDGAFAGGGDQPFAGDPYDLLGVGEPDAPRGGEALQRAILDAAVASVVVGGGDWDISPGQGLDPGQQSGRGVSRAARCPGGSFPKKQPPSSFGVCWSASALDQGLSPRLSDLAGSE